MKEKEQKVLEYNEKCWNILKNTAKYCTLQGHMSDVANPLFSCAF